MAAPVTILPKVKERLFKFFPTQPPLSPQEEARYRAQFLVVDATQSALGMFFFLLLVIPSFFNDYQFFGRSDPFYLLATFRIAVIILSLFFIIFIRRIKKYSVYDRTMAVWEMLGLVAVLSINLTRPQSYYMFVAIDVSIIFAVYIVFRSRFLTQAALALAFSAGDLAVVLITKDVPAASLRAIVTSYILANCLGLTALWLLNAARRREFLSHEKEAAALIENHRLETEKYKQSRLEAIGALAGGIAHDFNNVLTGVIGNIDLAAEALVAHNHNEVSLRLKGAMSASEHGKDLSRLLLTFAKGGAPDIQTIDLPDLVRDATAFSLEGSNVTAEITLEEGLSPVDADAGQISQVISILVINARQAMPGGGRVKISARNITRGGNGLGSGGRFVLLQMEDSGPGIAAEDLDHIFDPFVDAHKKDYGLGLPVAYSIIKKHGGSVEVQSIPGAGTFFYVYLPASENTPASAQPHPSEFLRPRSGRILLMDDDEVIRTLLLGGVQRAGYQADSAGDGAEALTLYRQALEGGKPYDVVVLDLTVPGGMGGEETLRKLKELNPHVVTIASSGYSDDPVLANYRAYGFSNALPKPYTITALLSVLAKSIP